ncbi:hypothetical protein OUZ56_018347 [Daphnia magna]|uniref:Uncharacterized protein n=1 Tax=Daphnia magna TaxID=35525 RepID=A0ABQ9Z8M1_9CRUS|nr:hypothetical protein OUZ56_018347 [Daphnia magna]
MTHRLELVGRNYASDVQASFCSIRAAVLGNLQLSFTLLAAYLYINWRARNNLRTPCQEKVESLWKVLQQKVVPVNAKMRALVTIKIRVLEQFLPVINTY